MLTIPPEEFKLPSFTDPELIRAWEWLMNFIPTDQWKERKQAIESSISTQFRPTRPFSEPISKGTAIVYKEDQIGWYLYLAEMGIKEPHKYEFYQGARVIPFLTRMGADFEMLLSIENIEANVSRLIHHRKSEADALLFELLTALGWRRNGWDVCLLAESKTQKTPDFIARKGSEEWYVECKRQSKTSNYSAKERSKWEELSYPIKERLLDNNMLAEIIFHTPLETLPATYLKDLLYDKIPLITEAGKVISNNEIDVSITFIDINYIDQHLKKFVVKNGSPMMAYLIGGKQDYNLGFSSGMYADFYKVGEGTANNLYVRAIHNAFGIWWSCDAPESIISKARDIKRQFVSALSQFEPEQKAVIHIGLETFDGPAVERARFEKISNTLDTFDVKGKNLNWAYCHFFQAYSPIDTNWTFDETVSTISSNPVVGPPPLVSKFLIVPEETGIDNINHWDRPLP